MQAPKKTLGMRAAVPHAMTLAEKWAPPVFIAPPDNYSIIRAQSLEVTARYREMLKEQKKDRDAPRNIQEPFTLFFTELEAIDRNEKHVAFRIQIHKETFPDNYWANCQFQFEATFPPSFPADPPLVFCRTPIYHPNIDDSGKVCLSLLDKDKGWTASTRIIEIIEAMFRTWFQEPNGNDPLPACLTIANELLSDPETFRRKAKAHAEKHKTFIPGSEEHRRW